MQCAEVSSRGGTRANVACKRTTQLWCVIECGGHIDEAILVYFLLKQTTFKPFRTALALWAYCGGSALTVWDSLSAVWAAFRAARTVLLTALTRRVLPYKAHHLSAWRRHEVVGGDSFESREPRVVHLQSFEAKVSVSPNPRALEPRGRKCFRCHCCGASRHRGRGLHGLVGIGCRVGAA